MRNFLNESLKPENRRRSPRALGSGFSAMALTLGMVLLGHLSATAQCSLTCEGSVEINLPDRNDYTVTANELLADQGQSCPNGNFRVRLFDETGANIGNKVNFNHIGQVILAEVTDMNTATTCSTDLEVVDNEAPVISTQDLYVVCSDSILPRHIGYPGLSDNISLLDSSDLNYSDTYSAFPCFTMVGDSTLTGQVDRTWFAVDDYGNVGTIVQRIYYVRKTIGDVVFPKNRDGFEAPYLLCQRDDVNDIAMTGSPTINGNSIFTYNSCEFSVTYTDQTSVVCGGETRTLRRWNVIDWCTDTSKTVVQVIRVRDVQAPSVAPPDTLFLTTDQGKCGATVMLPDATVSDSCSTTTLSKIWDYGTGSGPFNNVPVGSHQVTYRATDQCGNLTNAQSIVVIEDDELPTAVCDVTKEISLLSSGMASVFAISFNDGSHDNCGIEKFEVARDGEPFSNKVSFSCADIGQVVKVTMRVTDIHGLANECEVDVYTADYQKPSIACPAPAVIGCDEDYMDLNLWGQASGDDNCTVASIDFTDAAQLNQCGIGTVVRTWMVTDQSGNFSTCKQILSIEDDTPISVTFPADIELFECGVSTLPAHTGQPILNGEDCEDVEVTYFDQTFQTSFPACYKILRRWTVVDWCAYTGPNGNNDGIWTSDQTIRITDNEAPDLFVPADITIGAGNTSCTGDVILTAAYAEDCSNQVSITNNASVATTSGANASGKYPVGVHMVTFTASDGCGNTTTASMKVTVVDDKPPTPVCNRGVSISLNSDGQVYITPAIIAQGSFDNCTPSDQISMEIAPSLFTCGELGEQDVTLYAFDAAGNRGSCVTQVLVQDQLGVCNSSNNKASIGGKLETMGGTPANQVLVGLSGGLNTGRQSNVDGVYLFEGLPKNEEYTITPTYDVEKKKGLSTLDLVIIQKHILNVERFASPYQWIAADANNSKTVTTLDMVILRKLILNVSDQLPNNTSWRFVDASYAFPTDIDPLHAPFPEAITVPQLAYNRLNNHFVAIKVGDVNGSAKLNTTLNGNLDPRSNWPEFAVKAADIDMKAGETYQIQISIAQQAEISGMQFSLELEPGAGIITDVQTGDLPGLGLQNVGRPSGHSHLLNLSWGHSEVVPVKGGEQLIFLEIAADKDTRLSEVLSITSSQTAAEVYLGSEAIQFARPVIQFEEGDLIHKVSSVLVAPNPFRNQTTLHFENQEAGKVQLKLLDVNGKLLYNESRTFPAGAHNWMLGPAATAERTGIIIYQLQEANGQMHIGKMIKTDR